MGWLKMGDPGNALQREMLKSLAQRKDVGVKKSRGAWRPSQNANKRRKAEAERRRRMKEG